MLKSLELFGFKSFADRTLFEFAPGITCVVGPNGSGKSNVVDAIKWILGDQSAKSLRGKEMSDVIFNGSAGRRGSGFAEATLAFDNSQGLLGIDTAEVQIGRRLYQSGDSEYLLNRAPVRLKDIRDLFMGTGAGTAAYSIIEQGRVDQILQANPATRRLVFEEAAGISKFKSRRIDAERRLERVAQNLVRLTDIVDQVEGQLNSTRSQATKAARFRELTTELKAAWTGLAADDCRILSAQLQQQIQERDALATEIDNLQGRASELETGKRAVEDELSALEALVQTHERESAQLRSAIVAHESTIRHQSTRSEELSGELSRLRRQRLQLSAQVNLARSELASTSQRLEKFEQQVAFSQGELQQREARLAELEQMARQRQAQIDQRRKSIEELRGERQRLSERLAGMVSQHDSLEHQRDQARQRLTMLETELATAQAELETRRQQLVDEKESLERRQSEFSSSQQERVQLVQERDDAVRKLRDLRERRSAAEARRSVLEELDQKQETVGLGAKEILKQAQSSPFSPWSGVLGLVRDLIDVPMDLAPIVDAALGERAQLIAVQSLEPVMAHLMTDTPTIDGRVGFVSIHPLSAEAAVIWPGGQKPEVEEFDLTGQPGVYGRADRLVVERETAAGLSQQVLGDTWIVESLETARAMLACSPSQTRFVTLLGEVLVHDQQLFCGVLPRDSSIISRKSELRQLQEEIRQLHAAIEEVSGQHTLLNEQLQNRSGELSSLETELQSDSHALTAAATRLAGQEREVERIRRQLAEQQQILDGLETRLERLAAEQATTTEAVTQAGAGLLSCESTLAGETEQMNEVAELLRETQLAIKTEQLEFAKHGERLRGLRESQLRLERDQESRLKQSQELTGRMNAVRRSHQVAIMEILSAESALAMQALQLEDFAITLRGMILRRDELRQQRQALATLVEQEHLGRRQLVDRRHALEFEVQKQQHQLSTLAERIQEEYQLALDDLVLSGVSAYQQFLAEQYGTLPAVLEQDSEAPALESESALIPEFEEVRPELEARVDRLRRKLKALGNVNTDALENLEELETRFASLSSQLKDLQEAKSTLEAIIRRINVESRRIFLETFETIRGHFQELFRKLFGGGDADIVLENPDDVLECGIDIVARPPGKELRSISLLSGGEKTMTAVGLLFAMFRSKPSPYCILDEVDAALDEANVDRYVTVLKEFVSMTQFVVITHRKRTMTAADVLYGVTMEQAGVSKRISVRFEDVRDNGEIRKVA